MGSTSKNSPDEAYIWKSRARSYRKGQSHISSSNFELLGQTISTELVDGETSRSESWNSVLESTSNHPDPLLGLDLDGNRLGLLRSSRHHQSHYTRLGAMDIHLNHDAYPLHPRHDVLDPDLLSERRDDVADQATH